MLNKITFYTQKNTFLAHLEAKLNIVHSHHFSLGINNKIVKFLTGNRIFETNMILVVLFFSPPQC